MREREGGSVREGEGEEGRERGMGGARRGMGIESERGDGRRKGVREGEGREGGRASEMEGGREGEGESE